MIRRSGSVAGMTCGCRWRLRRARERPGARRSRPSWTLLTSSRPQLLPDHRPLGGPAPMAAAVPTAAPTSDPWGGPPVPPAADPWGGPAPTPASGDPWRPAAPAGPSVDPWGGTPAPAAGEGPTPDPWGSSDGGVPVSGPSASDPWTPAPAFSDPWGGSPAKPSTNGTTATGGFDTEPDEFSDFDRLRTALPTSGSSAGELELLAGEVPARSPGAFDMSGVRGSLAEAVGSPHLQPHQLPRPPPGRRRSHSWGPMQPSSTWTRW